MKMADKNIVYPAHLKTHPSQLHLSTLTTINKKNLLINIYQLRTWVAD